MVIGFYCMFLHLNDSQLNTPFFAHRIIFTLFIGEFTTLFSRFSKPLFCVKHAISSGVVKELFIVHIIIYVIQCFISAFLFYVFIFIFATKEYHLQIHDETHLFYIVCYYFYIYLDFVIPCKRRLRQGFPCARIRSAPDGSWIGRTATAFTDRKSVV